MTWEELYNRTVFKIWGTSTPPALVQAVLQGQYGLIANAHFKLQQDFNFWFMEDATTIAMVDGTSAYALPTNFKEVVKSGFRFLDSVTGDYYPPITQLKPGVAFEDYRGSTDESDYPTYYEIYNGQIVLYPKPSLTGAVLQVRYYGYLDRPPAVFGTTYDDLTRNGYNAIVALAAADMCKILEEYQKQQIFEAEANTEISLLHQADDRMRRAEITECEYKGF